MPIDIINDTFDTVTITVGLPGTQGPAGPQGVAGPPGALGPANTLTIGTVTTGNTGDPADATLTGTAPSQVLNLTIPRGLAGAPGPQGEPGVDGAGIAFAGSVATYAALPSGLGAPDAGDGYLVQADGKLYIWDGSAFPSNGAGVEFRGPTGPANTLTVGTVTTGAAGSSASVGITGTAPSQVVSFTIPRGDTGATGAAGAGIIAGGATLSVLAKASDTDFDTEWLDSASVGTPLTVVRRDDAGRAQVAAPSAGNDIANKTYVDDAVNTASSNNADVLAATSAPTASTLMKRDINGRAQVVSPSANADIATKLYVDSVGNEGVLPSSIMRRDSAGRGKVNDPAAGTDIANKQYVDAIGNTTVVANSVIRRDAAGRAKVAAPAATDDVARLDTVTNYAGLNTASFQTGTTYTFSALDQFREVDFSNGAAITVTVPDNATVPLPVGTVLKGVQFSTGTVTFVGAAGVTVSPMPGRTLALRGAFAVAFLIKRDTNHWVTFGDFQQTSYTADQLELFQDTMNTYIDVGSGMSKNYDDASGLLTLSAAGATLSQMPASTLVYVVQNSGGTWPNRPTSRTDMKCIWIRIVAGSSNPTAVTSPTVTGAYTNDIVVGA